MIPKYITLKEKINSDILSNIYPIGSKLPTEVELAAAYNVSRSTVRQALDLLVKQGIIEKRWGSGNTVVGKSDNSKAKTIMVLLPNSKHEILAEALSDIQSTLLKNGYEVEFHETKNQYQIERNYLNALMDQVYGGLIILVAHSNLPSTNADILQIQLKRQLPIVFINSAPETLYNPVVIGFDHYNKGYQMARFLINSGHKKIGGIFIQDSAASIRAFSGFMDAIRDANLEICDNCFMWCHYGSSSGINRFLKSAYDTVSAVYADDSSITGDGTYPIFTSSLYPTKSLGKECAHAIIAIKKNGNSKSVTIPYK